MMKISLVFMKFPSPSEAFASSDVRILSEQGCLVHVYNLRGKVEGFDSLVSERCLDKIKIENTSTLSNIFGLIQFIIRPNISLALLFWCFKYSGFSFIHLGKTIALMPRVLDVFRCIQKSQPDVVHLFWGHYPAMLGFLIKKFCRSIRLSMFLGAYDLETAFKGSWMAAGMADIVWTHAHCNRKVLEQNGISPARILVCHRGIDLRLIPSLKTRDNRKFRIVSAGRLVPGKNFGFVIDVFQHIYRKWQDAELVLLGEGPERSTLEKKVEDLSLGDAVTFRGHVNHACVFEEFANSQIFLFCSENPSERLPNVVKEAMASGCVCIVTPTKGIDELVQDGVTGFVVEKNIGEIVRLVDYIFENAGARTAISANAVSFISKEFNAEKQIAQQLHVWKGLVDTSGVGMDAGLK